MDLASTERCESRPKQKPKRPVKPPEVIAAIPAEARSASMNRRERLMHGPKEEKRVKEKRKLRPDLLEKQKDGELRPSHQRITPTEEHKGVLLPMTRLSVRSEFSCALSGMPVS